jgi:hypothetical protein
MLPFETLWKNAKELGADIEGTAKEFYETYKEKLSVKDMQTILNVFGEIDNYLTYLGDEKIDLETLNKLKTLFKEHRHLPDGTIVKPIE